MNLATINGGLDFERPPTSEPAPAEPWSSRITPIERDWCVVAPPKRAWLLRDGRTPDSDGVLPLAKVGQLVAEGGGGKTTALVQLGIAVATGTPWLGSMNVAAPGRALLILGEEDPEECRRRVYYAAKAVRAPVPEPGMLVTLPLAGVPSEMIQRDERGNPADGAFLHWLRAYLAFPTSTPWRLIAVDPLSRFGGLDAEKDNALATRFVEALESVAGQVGASVLLAHHSNQASRGAGSKLTATSSRGVTALVDGVRWAATMAVEQVEGLEGPERERLGEIVTIAFAKSNYSRKGAPIVLRRDLTNGGALVPLDEADEEIVAAARASTAPTTRKDAERAERTTARHGQEDQAVVSAVAGSPGILSRALRGQLMLSLKIGRAAADDAVERAIASGRVQREGSRHAGYRHTLDGGAP